MSLVVVSKKLQLDTLVDPSFPPLPYFYFLGKQWFKGRDYDQILTAFIGVITQSYATILE